MKAGVDIGSTLTKVVWQEDGQWQFESTAQKPLEQILRQLQKQQIKQLHLSGIGLNHLPLIKGFDIRRRTGDVIMSELLNQVAGVNYLHALQHKIKLDDFLLVSMGTGTSYTRVRGAQVRKFPLGNALAGGFLYGMSKFMGYTSYFDFMNIAKEGKLENVELLLKDKMVETAETPMGDLLVSHLAKISAQSEKADIQAGFVNMVAIAAVRDMVLIDMVPEFSGYKKIVCIGSNLQEGGVLREALLQYQPLVQKEFIFLNLGEFSNALGVYHLAWEDMANV